MATKAAVKPTENENEGHPWTRAQLRRFNELQGDVARARRDLAQAEQAAQKFVDYLAEEHDVDTTQNWVVGPRGFILAPEPPQKEKGKGDKDAAGEGNAATTAEGDPS